MINFILEKLAVIICFLYLFTLIYYKCKKCKKVTQSKYLKCYDKLANYKYVYFLHLNLNKTLSQKNFLLFVITFFIVFSTLISNTENILQVFSKSIIISFFSSILLTELINSFFPLEDGIDKQTNEENVSLRKNTLCKLMTKTTKVEELGEVIGKEFAEKLNIKETTSLKNFENLWENTDVTVAHFYEKILLKEINEGNKILTIILVKPYWHDNEICFSKNYVEKELNKKKLPKICKFNHKYIEGIITVFFEKTKNTMPIKIIPICIKENYQCQLFIDNNNKQEEQRCIFYIEKL